MARIVLVTGGGRSGKSGYARELAESLPEPRAFVATCPVLDEEMRERIRKHKDERRRSRWDTIEETLDLAGVLRGNPQYQVMLVDCLTLWINNLMYEAEKARREFRESDIEAPCREVLAVCGERPGTAIFVTNEVGLGIIPANPAARRFRDLAGRCNQIVAARADEVTMLVSGIPMRLKG